jgi:hypothetical protein
LAFRQYTSCIKASEFSDTFAGNEGLIVTAIVGVLYLLSLVAASFFNPAFIILAIGAVSYLIAYLQWWLHGRLICLSDEDQCVIGVAISKPSVKALQKGGDNDASFNVALAPSRVELLADKDPNSDDQFSTRLPEPKEHYWENAADPNVGNKQQGKIVEPNAQVLGVGRGYVSDDGHVRYLKAIHCEFEGSGIQDLLDWAHATLALLLAIAALSAFPGLGLFLTLLALLLSLIGAGAAALGGLNPGDPQDVLGNMGAIATTDIVIVKGNWVYDSLHDGWNEIHAIHACQVIGSMPDGKTWPAQIDTPDGFTDILGLDTPENVARAIGVWCLALRQAEDAEDGGNRDDPQNNWVLHPLVDGCSRDIIE